jgi:ribosomal protein S6
LAYSYKRDGVEIKDGWYVVFTYEGFPDIIPKLEKEYRIDDTVLKFMTIRRDPEEDELSEYAEVTETEEEAKSPAESNTVESEQSSSGSTIDCWDKVFDL